MHPVKCIGSFESDLQYVLNYSFCVRPQRGKKCKEVNIQCEKGSDDFGSAVCDTIYTIYTYLCTPSMLFLFTLL